MIKGKILKILNNKYIDNFLIGLILLNFVIFIFQTDSSFYNKYQIFIDKVEILSVAIFTVEYMLRLCILSSIKELFKPMMIIDFLAIFPYYLSFVSLNTLFLRILRVLKLFRIAKLARYTDAFFRIKRAFIKRKDEIVVMTLFFAIGLTLSSIFIYFAENQTSNSAFSSIPSSFWWSVVTFTSVGYGDTYPITTLGKIIGAITAIMGVGLHAMLIGVIGAAFIEATKKEGKV